MTQNFEIMRTIAIILHILSLLTISTIGYFTLTRLKSEKREYFVLFLFFTALTVLGVIFQMMANTVDGGLLGWRLVYLGGMFVAPLFLMFVQHYCEIRLNKGINAFAFVSALIVIVLTWTSESHDLIFTTASLYYPYNSPGPGISVWGTTAGSFWIIVVIQPTICVLLTVYVLIKKWRYATSTQKKRLGILIFCATAPGLSQLFNLFNFDFFGMHYGSLIVPLTCVVMYFGLSKYDLLENDETIRAQTWFREMVKDVSHETKTPLTVISVLVQQASTFLGKAHFEDEKIGALVKDSLSQAQEEIMRTARLTNSTLWLASMQTSDKERLRMIEASPLLRHSSEVFRPVLQKNGNDLDINIPDTLPQICGNADRLVQVMSNLLNNANNHTQNGEITVTAELVNCNDAVSKTEAPTEIKVTISDTGTGITPELLPHIFKRGVSGSGGTGVGLYITKDFIEAHGGKIEIESGALNGDNGMKHGTTVIFTIPTTAEVGQHEQNPSRRG